MIFDVIVIGGGIMGMLTARNLLKQGYRIALIEKGFLGKEATWAAGGILSSLYPWHSNLVTQSLIAEGQRTFPLLAHELQQETQVDVELIQSGLIVPDAAEKHQALAWAQTNNQQIDLITQKELLNLEPRLNQKFRDAIYIPYVSQVRPPRLIQALEKSLQRLGITLFENTEVIKVLIQSNNAQGVLTATQKIIADKIVICAGAWATSFSQGDTKMDVEPVRGQMLLYKPNESLLTHIICKNEFYLIPRRDGHVLCGSTHEHVGFNKQVTAQANQQLSEIAQQFIPDLAHYQPVQQWAGLRPGTPRNIPYVCQHSEIAGLYLNCGHSRYGIILSIASARIIAELVANTRGQSKDEHPRTEKTASYSSQIDFV